MSAAENVTRTYGASDPVWHAMAAYKRAVPVDWDAFTQDVVLADGSAVKIKIEDLPKARSSSQVPIRKHHAVIGIQRSRPGGKRINAGV